MHLIETYWNYNSNQNLSLIPWNHKKSHGMSIKSHEPPTDAPWNPMKPPQLPRFPGLRWQAPQLKGRADGELQAQKLPWRANGTIWELRKYQLELMK